MKENRHDTGHRTVRVDVHAPSGSYPIFVGTDLADAEEPRDVLKSLVSGRRLLVVADATTDDLFAGEAVRMLEDCGAGAVDRYAFPAGEQNKTPGIAEAVCRNAARCGLGRDDLFVALGGGVPGDVAGFAAAVYMRGVDFIQIPTTLLAMVDSSVGGKTGVDLPEGKNLMGAFHQPRLVLADIGRLRTLPLRQLRAGLAEVVKYGVIMDRDFFDRLDTLGERLLTPDPDVYVPLVARCCACKAEIVAADETESRGVREVLNFGHTFAHAIEALAGYNDVMHGEAVAVGMLIASRLGLSLGMCRKEVGERLQSLLSRLGLPTSIALPGATIDGALAVMRRDKKARSGRIRFVLPTAIGHVEIRESPDEKPVREAMERYIEFS